MFLYIKCALIHTHSIGGKDALRVAARWHTNHIYVHCTYMHIAEPQVFVKCMNAGADVVRMLSADSPIIPIAASTQNECKKIENNPYKHMYKYIICRTRYIHT